jgi:HD-like signal output (HDOD) protein
MITLMISDSNAHELQILEAVFAQKQFVAIPFNPSYQFYVKLLQYSPDIVLIEMPNHCKDQLHFVELMRKHKKLYSIPVIGFGDAINSMVLNHYKKIGLNNYITRPLKIAQIIKEIEALLHKKITSEKKNIEKPVDDFSFLFDRSILPLKKIEFMADHVSKLMAFPFTVTKVMSLTSNDNSGAKQLAQVINSDPTISAQILKVANSVFFASLNRRISSIHDAIVRIGFNETKRIVMSMAIMDMFDRDMHNAGFKRTDFWYHSISCAIISERLARRISLINPDEAFLSGLLHDLGILLMDEYFPAVFSHILNLTTEHSAEFIAEEKMSMGITHIDFTVELFERWKIPTTITRGISKKDNFSILARDMVEDSQIGFCIGMAENLAKTLFLGQECDQYARPIEKELFQAAKLPNGFSDGFIKDVYEDILFYQQFLKLEKAEFPMKFEGIQNAGEIKICFVNYNNDMFLPPLLYLRKEGVKVDEYDGKDLTTLNNEYDLLISWNSPSCTIAKVMSLINISRRSNQVLNIEESSNIPIIVCTDFDSPLTTIQHEQISLIPKVIDMRKFDKAICEILEGRSVDYIKLFRPVMTN